MENVGYLLMIRDVATIHDAIEELKYKGLVLKIVEGLQDYLSCEIKFSNNKKHASLEQQPSNQKPGKEIWLAGPQSLES